MANFYQYKFISPDSLFATIKEEMRSYFSSGTLDDAMFGLYLSDALRKLSSTGTTPIKEVMLFVDCFEAKLPPQFIDVRECWLMSDIFPEAIRTPGAYYQQITTVLNKPYDACNPASLCDPCNPDVIQVVTKTNTYSSPAPFRLKYLLTPGNSTTMSHCHGSLNRHIFNTEKFHIERGKVTTEFREGDIYLMYYAKDEDCEGNQMIPENFRIEQFILSYIKYKLYEFLWNTDSGETYNQSKDKFLIYQQKADEAYIIAETEMKKQTIYQKVYGIYKDTHRNDVYERMMHPRRHHTRWSGIPRNDGF